MVLIGTIQINKAEFPTLFTMAMDYLPIQASSVPCERVFSSSAETDTKRRNRISCLTMEALQMLKFHLKKSHLNFMDGWVMSIKEMVSDDPEEDLLAMLLTDDTGTGGLQDSLDYYLDKLIRHIDDEEREESKTPEVRDTNS